MGKKSTATAMPAADEDLDAKHVPGQPLSKSQLDRLEAMREQARSKQIASWSPLASTLDAIGLVECSVTLSRR